MLKNIVINWKTTLAGVALVVVQALPYFGVELAPDIVKAITIILGGGGLAIAVDPTKK